MQKRSWVTSEAFKYTLYGVLFGFLFPILAIKIDLAKTGLEFNWKNILSVQKSYPIHYIIDTAPFFLGLFALLAGINLDKIKEKNQKLIKASKFKHDFLANMSHEIRTPMVGVVGMIDLLLKNTELDQLQKEYVSTIHQSSINLLEILNQILDLSKIEAGKFALSPIVTNPKEVIHQNLDLFSATAKSKGLEFRTDHSKKIPDYVFVDPNRLTQILSNLIGNAIKFSNQGTITIKTSLLSEKEDLLTIKVEVMDQGIGISKEDQKGLFQQFNQIHSEAFIEGQGSGLGLTICKKLVELMKGKLEVESAVGKGSNFWFTFESLRADAPIESKQNSTSDTGNQKYDLHVLLVEDSETNILVSKQILKYLGCTIDVAKNGQEALNIFEVNKYGLILMDINMPEMGGLEACRVIKDKYNNVVPPIFALTSNALPGDANKFIAKGMDDYISKPFTTETINIKLKNWFGDHHEYH